MDFGINFGILFGIFGAILENSAKSATMLCSTTLPYEILFFTGAQGLKVGQNHVQDLFGTTCVSGHAFAVFLIAFGYLFGINLDLKTHPKTSPETSSVFVRFLMHLKSLFSSDTAS